MVKLAAALRSGSRSAADSPQDHGRIDELGRIVVLMLDGKEIAGESVIVALGVDEQGTKHVLGLMQGGTENSRVVQHLLDDLIERGFNTSQRHSVSAGGSGAGTKAQYPSAARTRRPVPEDSNCFRSIVLTPTPIHFES